MADPRPVRLQLSRKKGFSLQALSLATNGLPAVNVARPSRWGNPYRAEAVLDLSASDVVRMHREWIEGSLTGHAGDSMRHALSDLRGKNVACFCKLGGPCHGDTLIDLANRPICEAA